MIIRADARYIPLKDATVQCCITSPPFWGLRDYGNAAQLGLEKTPEEYVANMVAVFREVRRVLKGDGVLWLNLGDCYATGGGKVGRFPGGGDQGRDWVRRGFIETQPNRMPILGLKPKDLVGIPWRAAFALQADGWYLRSDIIWAKPNPMPESVTDRPTKAHEYVFLMSKSAKYYYDAGAIAEPLQTAEKENCPARAHILGRGNQESSNAPIGAPRRDNSGGYAPRSYRGSTFTGGKTGAVHPTVGQGNRIEHVGRNRRTVWSIATQPYSGSHFATFPEEIPRLCILAGSRPGDVILDPFGGSGTTAKVALELGRRPIHLDIGYHEIAKKRCSVTPAMAGLMA